MKDKKQHYIMIGGKPEYVTDEEYRVIQRSKEKERYFMEELKRGKTFVDQDGQKVRFIPSREVSYERMLESGWDIPAEGETLDELMERESTLKMLGEAVQSLSPDEQLLIRELFFLEKSEQELSNAYHVTRQAIHKRKKKILKKMKDFFEKF